LWVKSALTDFNEHKARELARIDQLEAEYWRAWQDSKEQMTISGEPHLFRDEGDRVAHFVALFESRLTETPFGPKLLPALIPHWSLKAVHEGLKVTEVVAQVIQGGVQPSSVKQEPTRSAAAPRRAVPETTEEAPVEADAQARRARAPEARSRATYHGRIKSWGEERFPDRKRPGKSYKNFALKLEMASGMETLQGEGLKDAISEAGCKLGDAVEVKRLRKIKVPAFDEKSGDPVLDENGNQKVHDKWLWSISVAH